MESKKLNYQLLKENIQSGVTLLDMRPSTEFCEGFIPGSVYVSAKANDDTFSLINTERPLIVICSPGSYSKMEDLLERRGLTVIKGYYDAPLEEWFAENPVDVVVSLEPDEIAMDMKFSEPQVADIRQAADFEKGHLPGAFNLPFDELLTAIDQIPSTETIYMYCADGEQSLSLISYLKILDFNNIYHIKGGYKALIESGMNPSKS